MHSSNGGSDQDDSLKRPRWRTHDTGTELVHVVRAVTSS